MLCLNEIGKLKKFKLFVMQSISYFFLSFLKYLKNILFITLKNLPKLLDLSYVFIQPLQCQATCQGFLDQFLNRSLVLTSCSWRQNVCQNSFYMSIAIIPGFLVWFWFFVFSSCFCFFFDQLCSAHRHGR